jgi:uncharacterized flavoprotein (TIGR03862 family)
MPDRNDMKTAMVVGGGPAGLMAAEVLGQAGVQAHLYDAMPSVARKFLLAGKGGLNLTHSEPATDFLSRFGARQGEVGVWLAHFGAQHVRDWAQALGVPTFVGSSGRVFPRDMKAAPLLRAWLHRLRHPQSGHPVVFHMRHRWTGWDTPNDDSQENSGPRPSFLAPPWGAWQSQGWGRSQVQPLLFQAPGGLVQAQADVVVLALGGASWPRLGSDGAWYGLLGARGVALAPLVPANCGFDVSGGWSPHFAQRFAGLPFKSVALRVVGAVGSVFERKGEFVATATGVEGSLVYAAAHLLRDAIAAGGDATMYVDLLPAMSFEQVIRHVSHPRGSRSLSSHLKSRLGLDGIKAGLLHEVLSREQMADHGLLAATIKSVPLRLARARPVAEAISTAGGVKFEAMDPGLMLTACPGVFCAGEMLDWEAPTGGYLLTAAMASGRAAAVGALAYLDRQHAGQAGP